LARIVLVYPITGLDVPGVSIWLPLSVLSVASTLVDAYDVAIVDQRVDPAWRETLRRHLTADTLAVGISSMTGAQIRNGLEAAAVVRQAAPDVLVVWGGNHPTLLPEQTARHGLVDAVVIGEGEKTFRLLVDALAEGRDWRATPNIAYKSEGGVKVQGDAYDFVKQEDLPPLPYHLVEVERYITNRILFGRAQRSLPFIGSSGCPYACTFCCQPVLSNRRWRRMSAEKVVERTLELKSRYALDAVEFHDEEFFVDRRRGARIAEGIGGAFRWYAQTRMDDLLELDLPALERNGLAAVQPGLESGSDRVLRMIKKGETVDDYRRANAALARTGIRATYNFMLAFPTETAGEVRQTVDLALELLAANPGAQVSAFYAFVPYPGSELFDLAVKHGFAPPDTLEGWSAFSRHQVSAPWLLDKAPIDYLMTTSRFIDGRRMASGFAPPLARGFLSSLSRRYQARWREGDFSMTWDVRLLSAASRWAVSK
jgi:radical SAM superfamily enzyme YgiQ (UPF0313 family)